jgi:hypothetical protein
VLFFTKSAAARVECSKRRPAGRLLDLTEGCLVELLLWRSIDASTCRIRTYEAPCLSIERANCLQSLRFLIILILAGIAVFHGRN